MDQYDDAFKRAANQYLHNIDWRWLKAQGIQESQLDRFAVSGAGAQGVMQFMPGTWPETMRKMGLPETSDPFDAELSINAGAFYMSRMVGEWKRERPKMDRYCLALASYNAGLGNILAAQVNQGDPALYAPIIAGLSGVTGIHAVETIGYVEKIFDYYRDQVIRG